MGGKGSLLGGCVSGGLGGIMGATLQGRGWWQHKEHPSRPLAPSPCPPRDFLLHCYPLPLLPPMAILRPLLALVVGVVFYSN